eukprot:gnl/TRDRNA2_/TRDRNA2_164679_c2_seq1.p1 gnl/TRDRNA2_/TRDRNA2_164679_c2~~gnl/TRDRNA2_/TRDRNA2_164679_c2_seq1.p1  ORF type:complete len:736 (+),score=121.26 gnl/TRDRNA2_/TRDRNA2_164679_c2_seq1:3-2210(+)
MRIEGSEPAAIKLGHLVARALVAGLMNDVVDVQERPEADDAQLSMVEIPELAGNAVQPRKLLEQFDVIASFVKIEDKSKAEPTSAGLPAFAKIMGLAVGTACECRYGEDWYNGNVVGFEGGGHVVVQWLGGDEDARAVLPAVDVRVSKKKAASEVSGNVKPGGLLVIFGGERGRMGALLHAMAATERRVAGHFADRNPIKPSANLFGFGLKLLKLPATDGGLVARNQSKIAAASECIVEVLGKSVALAGEPDERRRAEAICLHMMPQAGAAGDASSVHEELQECCSHVRVPRVATAQVSGKSRADLESIEAETGTMCFWLPVGTAVTPRKEGGGAVRLAAGGACTPGTKIQAKYQGEWYPATVLGVGSGVGKVRIEWEFDGSESDVLTANTKTGNSDLDKRQDWLKQPRVLAIIGPERQRRACALRVMASSERACRGLWTSSTALLLAEVRDGAGEDEVIFGMEAFSKEGSDADLEWAVGPQGQQALHRAATAANCKLEYVGRIAVFVGFPEEREKGREYARWAVASRRPSARGPTLSLPDADMREDITICAVPEGKVSRLKPDKLWPIERSTETLILFDDGGGSALEEGQRRLLVCGCNANYRQQAVGCVLAMCKGPSVLDAAAAAASDPISSAPRTSALRRPLEVSGATEPERKVASRASTLIKKTDPREELRKIPWPASINAWGMLQNTIWAGHPKLKQGWIRVWSRSQDSEYYLRLKDMKTSFDLAELEEE